MATFPHWLCHLQQLAGTLLTLLVDYRAHTLFLKGLGGVRGVKFTYDPRYNIAYIRFREKHGDIDSVRISDELVVDMAPDGTLYGIELLNPNEQLRRDETEKLLIINEATGEQVEFPLATS
jgi:uncharacterized protein YuzE